MDNYPAADGGVVRIVAGSDANFARPCAAMGWPDLLDDARFATLADRARHGDEINDVVAAWTADLPAAEVERACLDAGVPVARAYTAADITADPHLEARGDLVTVDDPVVGPVRQQAPLPAVRRPPARAPRGRPDAGAAQPGGVVRPGGPVGTRVRPGRRRRRHLT
jgi:formyl-CoA transferase